ncbi:MAG: tryptophan 2,3-dioxygenase family protein [Gemmatimonadaceae bacterium]
MSQRDASPGAPASNVSYASYLALNQLLELQRTLSQPEHPDELLFMVVHQASELWFKAILHELEVLVTHMESKNALGALYTVGRLNALMRIVTAQLSALDTLPPQHFAQFRGFLGTSSGSQSAQFRAIEAASGLRETHFLHAIYEHGEPPEIVRQWIARPTLQDLFDGMVREAGTTYEELYSGPGPGALVLLAEGLLEYEQSFSLWRFLHVQLVERVIGPGTGGTGGTLGATYLQRSISTRFFPRLWDVRAKFFGAAKR